MKLFYSLPALALAFVLATGVQLALPDAAQAQSASSLSSINQIRKSKGRRAVVVHPALQRAAKEQAVLMARHGKMSHSVGRGNSFGARLRRAGFSGRAVENVGYGYKSPGSVAKAWMGSRGHRRNMMQRGLRYGGFASARRGKTVYWALILGK